MAVSGCAALSAATIGEDAASFQRRNDGAPHAGGTALPELQCRCRRWRRPPAGVPSLRPRFARDQRDGDGNRGLHDDKAQEIGRKRRGLGAIDRFPEGVAVDETGEDKQRSPEPAPAASVPSAIIAPRPGPRAPPAISAAGSDTPRT